jgi:hypothetical protein
MRSNCFIFLLLAANIGNIQIRSSSRLDLFIPVIPAPEEKCKANQQCPTEAEARDDQVSTRARGSKARGHKGEGSGLNM